MESKSFCALPWISVAIRNDGDFRVCCNANVGLDRGVLEDSAGKKLNARDSTIEEARNSAGLKSIRQSMLAGDWPLACHRCKNEEASGLRSKRQFVGKNFPAAINQSWAENITSPDGAISLAEAPLLDLDVRFGNLCNLACRMCGPSDSSTWVKELKKMNEPGLEVDFSWHESPLFWESLEKNAGNLEHIYIVGGEPLLIERHYDFLGRLVLDGRAKNITLEYNTNLTALPDKALALWEKFKCVKIGVSFDGEGIFHEYIRYPSKFPAFEKNLRRLDKARGNFKIWIACTVSIYNFHHLVDFMIWVHDQNFQKIGRDTDNIFFAPHPVHRPYFLNIQAYLPELKPIVKEHLVRRADFFRKNRDLSSAELARLDQLLEKYFSFLNQRDQSEHWVSFQYHVRKLDLTREQKFSALEPVFGEEKWAL